jgi:hypothetical protein
MITPAFKNQIVTKIVNSFPELYGSFEWEDFGNEVGCHPNLAEAVVRELVRKNLIDLQEYMGGSIIKIYPELITFHDRGGFLLDDLTFTWHFEKLRREIEQVKPKFSIEQYNAVSSSIAALAAMIDAAKPG